MKEPRHDNERLAELLEGRLEGPERDELLAYLANADEDFHVFARTAAVLREMEEEEGVPHPPLTPPVPEVTPPPAREPSPPSVRAGWRRWRASRVIVPPVLAGLVVLAMVVSRAGSVAGVSPVRLAAALGAESLPGGLSTVGGGSRGGAEYPAAEAGALLVDLAVSIQAGDSGTTATRAQQVYTRFDNRAVPGSPIRQIVEGPAQPPTVLLPLVDQETELLSARSDAFRDSLQLGAWTQAARIAAARQDTEFFQGRTTRAMLRRAARTTRDDPAARQAVESLRTALAADGARDWPAVRQRLDAVMSAITR